MAHKPQINKELIALMYEELQKKRDTAKADFCPLEAVNVLKEKFQELGLSSKLSKWKSLQK